MVTLHELACRFTLNGLPPNTLKEIAEALIVDGFESPSLIALLVCDSPYSHDRVALFSRALSELGQELPAKHDAALSVSTIIARKIVACTITPFEGAYSIWKDVLDQLDEIPRALWAFKSNASAIENCHHDTRQFGSDHIELIASCSAEIVAACHILLQQAA